MSKSPYHEAADLINTLRNSANGGHSSSLKNAAYDKKSGKLKISVRTYAVVAKVMQHQSTLDTLLKEVPISARNEGLLRVLLYELLLSEKHKIQGGGALKRVLLKKADKLRAVLQTCRPAIDDPSTKTTTIHFPRYLRVNTLYTSTLAVYEILKGRNVSVFVDEHVPDVLVVPQSATKVVLEHVPKHHCVLQDKSSCFSALCLHQCMKMMTPMRMARDDDTTAAAAAATILDACAAPGNKTSHAAALFPNSNIVALDRDDKRCKALAHRMTELVPTTTKPTSAQQQQQRSPRTVQVRHQDFLSTDPADFSDVSAILLDPSCSGSGLYTRNNNIDNTTTNGTTLDKKEQERVSKLQGFQITCLRHAMSFPNVHCIVYSTCSVHQEENEDVVAVCLAESRDTWELVTTATTTHNSGGTAVVLPSWPRRGRSHADLTKKESASLVRVNEQDDTNGFFVACFRRKGTGSSRQPKRSDTHMDCGTPNYWGIETYSGQFKKEQAAAVTDKNGRTQQETTSDKSSNSKRPAVSQKGASGQKKSKTQPGQTIHRGVDESSSPRNESIEDTPVATAASAKTMGKKRAKALAWKKRQMDSKRARVKALSTK